jgi:hypothetical protein
VAIRIDIVIFNCMHFGRWDAKRRRDGHFQELRKTMASVKESGADAKDAEAKPLGKLESHVPVDREDLEEGEEEEEPVEEIVIRAEPLPQQGAVPADVERGLRLIARCRERNADDVEGVRQLVRDGAPAGFIATSGWTPVAAAASVGNNNVRRCASCMAVLL